MFDGPGEVQSCVRAVPEPGSWIGSERLQIPVITDETLKSRQADVSGLASMSF